MKSFSLILILLGSHCVLADPSRILSPSAAYKPVHRGYSTVPIRRHRANEVSPPELSHPSIVQIVSFRRSEHQSSLRRVLADIQEAIRPESGTGCTVANSLFSYDLDETVLTTSMGRSVSINESRSVLGELRDLGIERLAISARPPYGAGYVQASHEDRSDPKELDAIGSYFQKREWKSAYLKSQVKYALEDLTHSGLVSFLGPSSYSVLSESTQTPFTNEMGEASRSGYFTLEPEQSELLAHPDFGVVQLMSTAHREKIDRELRKVLFYEQGLLMVGHKSKGQALLRLLELKGKLDHFRCIFFVDDDELRGYTHGRDNTGDMARAFSATLNKQIFIYRLSF